MSDLDTLASLRARVETLWLRPLEVRRACPWWKRMQLHVSGVPEGFARESLDAFAARAEPSLEAFTAHLPALLEELEENVSRAEHRVVLDQDPPPHELAWLARTLAWVHQVAQRRSSPHAFAQLTQGLGRRFLFERPVETRTSRFVRALLDEAAREGEHLARRRHLLEAARRILLSQEGASERCLRHVIAGEMLQLRRIEATGITPTLGLHPQLRSALRARHRSALTALAAKAYLACKGAPSLGAHTQADTALPLPSLVQERLTQAYERARQSTRTALDAAGPGRAMQLRKRRDFLAERGARATGRMALACDGAFELGGGLTDARFPVDDVRAEEVRFPTQSMRLHAAVRVDEIPASILDDPRRVIHQFASGELQTRHYTRAQRVDATRAGSSAEVRLFLLDGSTSMHGARARMRDGVLLAELSALVERLSRPGGRVRQLLYYRFFHTTSEPTRRIKTIEDALAAIDDLVGQERSGGTDIEGAIIDAFKSIHAARGDDIALSSAQIVLVSDGEAVFDTDAILDVRGQLGIPTRLSIIALGKEGRGLREFAVAQQNKGARVFYHHVSDEELEVWEHEQGVAQPAFAPSEEAPAWDALEALAEAHAPSEDESLEEAWFDAGFARADMDAATQARIDASHRDTRAVEARFDHYFPHIDTGAPPTALDEDAEHVATLRDAFAILEELDAPSATRLARMADAITLLLRILHAQGITPDRYATLRATHEAHLRDALLALRKRYGR
jgi:hypothetical protein